ncbi:hypothetical protein [Streptosporangium sp. NPDC051022]|uniref:hypothetical protein n=1 Tax=Streptosporangium sp. NPDC051022 TaxID=3155752 RepID=UPI0034210659
MTERRVRLAVLTAILVSLFAVSTGIANAAPGRTYRVTYQGPYGTQAVCNNYSASFNDPPDAYTGPCFQDTGGWFFRYVYSID